MEHGKHARHRRRVQRRPHLIVSLLVSLPVSFLLSFCSPFRHSVPPSSYPRPAGRYEKRGDFFSHPLVSFAEPVFTHALRRFRKLILSAVSSCRSAHHIDGRM